MNPAEAVADHLDLFKLDWVKDPSILQKRAGEHGLSDHFTLEVSAWCAEIHGQLAELAELAGLDLLLMGGNGTALRMDVSAQRGSRDNDYLTTAKKSELRALMRALRDRFAALPEPLFTSERHPPPEGAKPLPLVSYWVKVPALFATTSENGCLKVKVEFHLSKPGSLPKSENIQGEFLAVGQPVQALVPKVPYQLVLKAMTLLKPPIGVEAHREDVLPRQLYDLDVLVRLLRSEEDWDEFTSYGATRYEHECQQHDCSPSAGAPWKEFIRRLDEWAQCSDKESPYWSHINRFQSGQLARGSSRSSDDWLGRVRRLQFVGRCAQLGLPAGRDSWTTALAVEQLLPIDVEGRALRAQRQALHPVVGIAPKEQSARPRTTYWDYLARASELPTALTAIKEQL